MVYFLIILDQNGNDGSRRGNPRWRRNREERVRSDYITQQQQQRQQNEAKKEQVTREQNNRLSGLSYFACPGPFLARLS